MVEPGFETPCSYFFNLLQNLLQDSTDATLSVVGDVTVDSEVPVMILSISRIRHLSLSEMSIEIGLCTCIHSSECAGVFELLRLYYIFKRNTQLYSYILFFCVTEAR